MSRNNQYRLFCKLLLFWFLLYNTLSYVTCYYQKHIERYFHPDFTYNKPLLFDVQRFELIVGSRDYILILSLNDWDSHKKRSIYIPSTTEKQQQCWIKGMKKEQCHNFITTLLPIPTLNYSDKRILVCGTNAFSPECQIRRLSETFEDLNKTHLSINSYCPLWNTTSLITSTGEFFYGGPLDLRGIDSSITKQHILSNEQAEVQTWNDRRIVRSAQHDSKWINSDANFVFSFEFEKHVYFLFRETAVEYLNCGKRVYSRIGRVCKNDRGMKENWTSFLKTRINCSIPGYFPFYFDEIQSVDLLENSGNPILYATFSTPENSIHGSAVCAFEMQSILDAFDGPFKYQKSSSHIWESVEDDKEAFECKSSSNSSKPYKNYRLNSIYQLMDKAVQPITGRPFIISKNENLKFIAVDIIKTKYFDSVEVMFTTTSDGKLLKYVRWPTMNHSCLVDEIQLVDPKKDMILSMKFLKDTQSLYFGTEQEVIRVSAHRCHLHQTESQCLDSGDPYCGWSQTKMKCIKSPGNNNKDGNWIQAKTPKCPIRWSQWFTCRESNKLPDEACQCRKRPCQHPNAFCIDGYELEVTNCTQHGGWSEWSQWSQCNPSCGKGTQFRTRTCSNPPSLFNGKGCSGSSREERECGQTRFCNWGTWSDWTECSPENCTPGKLKKRTRQCLDDKGTPLDASLCEGSFVETTECNCMKSTDWTEWSLTDINTNEVIEERHEIPLIDHNLMSRNQKRVVSLKYCDHCGGYTYKFKGKEFMIKECSCSDEYTWTDWSQWSSCRNGTQSRTRRCLLTDKPCDGHHTEIRYCYSRTHLSSYVAPELERAASIKASWILLTAILSSLFTASCCYFLFQRREKPDMSLMNHTICEPNTYEEPEKYRITTPLNGHSTLTRTSTLKKNTSFRAKLDDSNY